MCIAISSLPTSIVSYEGRIWSQHIYLPVHIVSIAFSRVGALGFHQLDYPPPPPKNIYLDTTLYKHKLPEHFWSNGSKCS